MEKTINEQINLQYLRACEHFDIVKEEKKESIEIMEEESND